MITEDEEEEKIDSFNIFNSNIQINNKLSLKCKIFITSLIILIISLLFGIKFLFFMHINDIDIRDDLKKDINNLKEWKK